MFRRRSARMPLLPDRLRYDSLLRGKPAVKKDSLSIFLSYSRSGRQFAFRIAEDLKNAGTSVWLDQRDISPGDRWDQAVEKALTECSCVIVILSPSSVNSRNVLDEISFALEKSKQVIPVLYRDCDVPFQLRRIRYQDFRGEYVHALTELLGTLRDERACHPTSTASFRSLVRQSTGWKQLLAPPYTWVRLGLILGGSLALASVAYLLLWWLPPNKLPQVSQETRVVTDATKSIPSDSLAKRREEQTKTPGSVDSKLQLRTESLDDMISGEWHSVSFTNPEVQPSQPRQYYFKFKAIGPRLFGTVRVVEPPGHPTGIVYGIDNGRIDGNTMSFEYFGSWKHIDPAGNEHSLKESFSAWSRAFE